MGHNKALGPAAQYCSGQMMGDKSHFTYIAEGSDSNYVMALLTAVLSGFVSADAEELATDFLGIIASHMKCEVDADALQKQAFR